MSDSSAPPGDQPSNESPPEEEKSPEHSENTWEKEIDNPEVLKIIEETSKNARKIFFSMLLGFAYSWLTIVTTTDAGLLTNSASSPLPIIGGEIPIALFYWFAPSILLGGYIYLNFYLRRLWEELARLPGEFSDGRRLDQRVYPWLLNGLVHRYHSELKKVKRPLIAKLEETVAIALVWWFVPITLSVFWLRHLPRHEGWGTGLQIGLLVISIAVGILFYRLAIRTLRRNERLPPRLDFSKCGSSSFWRSHLWVAFLRCD